MDDPFRDALVVEVEDLLAQHEVFQQHRPARPGLEAVLVVADRHAVIGRQDAGAVPLLRFTAAAHGQVEGIAHCRLAGAHGCGHLSVLRARRRFRLVVRGIRGHVTVVNAVGHAGLSGQIMAALTAAGCPTTATSDQSSAAPPGRQAAKS